MKLAIQYSLQAETLLTEGAIAFDLFKCPAWADVIERITPLRPCYVHFDLNTCGNRLTDDALRTVEQFLDLTDTPYVNVHLVATTADFPDIPAGSDKPEHLAAVRDRMCQDIARLADRFGADRIIAENVIYRGPQGRFLYACVVPSVICDVVRQTGCGLLLDTAHASMTCQHTGDAVTDYLAALPLERLRELHVTGIQHDGDKWRDSMPLRDQDWQTVWHVLNQIRTGACPMPWAATLKYGGVGPSYEWRSDPVVLALQVPRLHAAVLRAQNRNPMELTPRERRVVVEGYDYDPRYDDYTLSEYPEIVRYNDDGAVWIPPGGEHMHCVFCSRTISRDKNGEDRSGYVSPDFNWLCTSCYETNVKLLQEGSIDWDESERRESEMDQRETERRKAKSGGGGTVAS